MLKRIIGIGTLAIAAVVTLAPAAQATTTSAADVSVVRAVANDVQPMDIPIYGGSYPTKELCQKAGRATSFPFHCHQDDLTKWYHLIYYI